MGYYPYTGLTLGADGIFYGTTVNGTNNYGSVFKFTTNGILTYLATFNFTNGSMPRGKLVQGTDGAFYGTTYSGGTSGGYGSVFKVTTNGVITSIASFDGFTNAGNPYAGLIQGSDGNFYGTTAHGSGVGPIPPGGYGSIFKVTPSGTLTTLVNLLRNGMNSYLTSPVYPIAPLSVGNDGNLYGTTSQGSINYFFGSNEGTIFKLTPSTGHVSFISSFEPNDGTGEQYPRGGLTLGSDGNFYGAALGTTNANGGIFKVTTNGIRTTVCFFNGTNGAYPLGAFLLGPGGLLYGTTYNGGTSNLGTVFRMTTNGVITSLGSFTGNNGSSPNPELTLGPDGNYYGTTYLGGTNGVGTIFTLVFQPTVSLFSRTQTNITYSVATFIGSTNRVWMGTNLSVPASQWKIVSTNFGGSTGSFKFTVTNTPGFQAKLYRVSSP